MTLGDEVRIKDLDVKTDRPPIGIVTDMRYKFKNSPEFRQIWVTVEFHKNLFFKKNWLSWEGCPRLSVEIDRLEEL